MAGFLMAELFDRPVTDPKGLLADCLTTAAARFSVTGPDLSGLGDLLNLSRQEVLDALFDAALDSFDLALPDAAFYSPDQPRVPAGSPGGGRWAGGVSPGTAAARDAAADAVRAFAAGQGTATQAEAEALAGHLARLTVAQIHALKAEHGLKGSAPNKAALVARMAQRFAAWRAGRAPKEAVPSWPADYDVFGKRDVFADEPTDAGTLAPVPVVPSPAVASAETLAEAEAERKAVRGTGDNSRRVGADGTTYVRAPAGGATSDVNGVFYRGGRWMPVHGLSAGQEKPPKLAGGAGDRPPAPNPEGKGREARPPRPPMSPEEIENLRRGREADARWAEVRAGELGRMISMGERPHAIRNPVTNLKDWKEYAARIGESGLQDLMTKLQPMLEESFAKQISRQMGGQPAPDDLEYIRGELGRRARDDADLFSGSKKHLKELPSSYLARQTVQEILGTAEVDDLYRLNTIMQSVIKKDPA